jgi:hypothetical protein
LAWRRVHARAVDMVMNERRDVRAARLCPVCVRARYP